ncbi:hypothetical protein DL93DRAFT_2076507 [Clavulina sp. PMI_390]|nr:hypothetical protein DL93DRAFT_2076507 [Clavulina sp. PMI_390]
MAEEDASPSIVQAEGTSPSNSADTSMAPPAQPAGFFGWPGNNSTGDPNLPNSAHATAAASAQGDFNTLQKLLFAGSPFSFHEECELSRAQWAEKWELCIAEFERAGDEQVARMLRDWYEACRKYPLYRRDETFPPLRQFDVGLRMAFVQCHGGFTLDPDLLKHPDGIPAVIADYIYDKELEFSRRCEASTAAIITRVLSEVPTTAPSVPPASRTEGVVPRPASTPRFASDNADLEGLTLVNRTPRVLPTSALELSGTNFWTGSSPLEEVTMVGIRDLTLEPPLSLPPNTRQQGDTSVDSA